MTASQEGGSEGSRRPAASRRPQTESDAARYRIEGLIGRGGMASVHRAYDSARGQIVALKRLQLPGSSPLRASGPPSLVSLSEPTSRESARWRARLIRLFQREYSTLAQLAHPCIVEVYDYGLLDDGPYYTMELLTGSDLQQLGRVPWQRACAILRDVASALTLLHARRLLHRDVSLRNVHCSTQGQAKLLDFGAMAPLGPNELLVGTPAFVAPEALQRRELDVRSDLYSLGVLGYCLLVGSPPYFARKFADLSESQRRTPLPPSATVPELPKGLDELIMQLIALDRAVRPGGAVEVVERLSALAGLEHDSRLALASAHLSSPTLVGRPSQLLAVRRRALRAQRGQGATLLVRADRGTGRSRFLDACAIEGELAGALVLRADPAGASGQEYAALQRLLVQIHAGLSQRDRERFVLPASVSNALLPGLVWTRAGTPSEEALRSPPLAAEMAVPLGLELHEYLSCLAAARALLILIDDFEQIDASSAAVIAGLSRGAASCKLVIVVSCESLTGTRCEPALGVIREHGRALELPPLDADHTGELLRSIFGDVPNLRLIADRLHALSGGKPSLCLELARHLIDKGVIRYEAGGFVLPEALAPSDLPDSLEHALSARFARLSPAARELGAMIALCEGAPLRLSQWLSRESEDERAAQRALGELIGVDALMLRGEHVTLRQSAFGLALLAGVGPVEREQLHARAALLLSENPDLLVHAAQHFLLAGQDAAALDLLLTVDAGDALAQSYFPKFEALIAGALQACARLNRPLREGFLLRRALVRHRIIYVEPAERAELLEHAFELEHLSGLSFYRELDPRLEPAERLARTLRHVTESFERTPLHERILAPAEAIRELATYTAMLAGYATSTFDWKLLQLLPGLAPFVALAPSIGIAETLSEALRALRAGRHPEYVDGLERMIERLDRADHAGLPRNSYQRTRLGVMFSLALTDAALGRPRAFEFAREMEALPQMRGNAWRVRQIAYMYRGDPHRADDCRRELELLLLQDTVGQFHRRATLEVEFMCYLRSEDLLGIRRVLPELEYMAQRFAGWRPNHLMAQGELERLRGRSAAALDCHERAFALMKPGEHTLWAHAASFRLRALVDLGRFEQARVYGYGVLAAAAGLRLDFVSRSLRCALASAESALGNDQAAIALVEAAIDVSEKCEVSGLYTGMFYEQRASLALRSGDRTGFWRYFERASQHYGSALDSPFTRRLSRLRAEERMFAQPRSDDLVLTLPPVSVETVRDEIAVCADLGERARCALALVIDATGAQAGHLFGCEAAGLQLLASSSGSHSGESLRPGIEQLLRSGLLDDLVRTRILASDGALQLVPPSVLPDSAGLTYIVFAISIERGSEELIVAAAALSGMRRNPNDATQELLSAIGAELFERGDLGRWR